MQNSLTQKLGLTLGAFAMAVTSLFTATDAEAVPAFARQTGMTCNSCHFQGFPSLNGMGRSFRAGGYTMKGTLADIEGEDMSLPTVMPFALFWKAYYVTSQSKGGTAYESSQIAWEDEFVFFAAGRFAENAGFLFELGMSGFNNSKLHFNVMQGGVNLALVPFSTDAAGRNFAMEMFNTGSQRSQRPVEKRDAVSAHQYTYGNGVATGLAIVVSDPANAWHVSYSLWGPLHNGALPENELGLEAGANLTDLAANIRAGYFFDLAGFDTGVGLTSSMGEVKASVDGGKTINDTAIPVAGTGIDFQMQGQVGGSDLGIYVTNSSGGGIDDLDSDQAAILSTLDEVGGGDINTGYTDGAGASATGLLLKYSVTPSVHAFYGMVTGTLDEDALAASVVGAHYMYAQNFRLVAESYSKKVGDGDANTKLYLGWMGGF